MNSNGTDAVSEIKARLGVEDVVGGYVQLKRSGRNFKGLSPWTNEKTPSLMVSPEKQIWHDFSSGKGGDIFGFVMEMEGVDFKGALELLARQAGVELEKYQRSSGGSNDAKNRLRQILELATRFYQRQLSSSQPALKYLVRQRGFSKQTVLDWRLGYAPHSDTVLADFLVKKGFSLTEIRRAGLAVERRGQTIDMFRNRVMIPLTDAQGVVVGFTARLLADQADAPKYINTPATILYDKSRQIFGLDKAKEAIRKSGFTVVAEGNLDVISSHQAKVTNVVASAGTAMTEQHLQILKRFSHDVRLSFDSDQAGLAAVERIIPLGQKAGVELKIINLPKGAKDPDELVRKDVKLWQKAIEQADYAVDWLISHYEKELDLTSASGKRAFSDIVLATVRRLADPVEQEHYINQVAKLTEVSPAAVAAKLAAQPGAAAPRLKRASGLQTLTRSDAEYQKLQTHLLTITFFEPSARDLLKDLPKDLFDDGPNQAIVDFLQTHADFRPKDKWPSQLKQVADYGKILELQFEELYQSLDALDRVHQAIVAKTQLVDLYVKQKRSAIVIEMATASDSALKKLIDKADKLNKLVKQSRELIDAKKSK